MDQQDPPSRRTLIACGALAAAAGGYVMLISIGVVPPPGEKNPHAPHWLVFCAGLAFVLAGVALGVRACAGGTPPAGCELPPDAPRWLHALQYLLVMAIIACFAAIGSFIAFAPGPRSFGISLPFLEMRGGAVIGRIAFGIGAVILWLCLIGFAVSGARRLIGRGKV